MTNLENATIAIQKSGRLTEGSLEWLNNNAGSDFPVVADPFDKRRELVDSATGITVAGYSNGDTLKATACGQTDLAICGSDKSRETIGSIEPNPLGLVETKYLGFATCRLVFARPEESIGLPVERVATTYPRQARDYFESSGTSVVTIDRFSGGVEMATRRGNYDGLVDLVHWGDSLRANNMQEVSTIRECQAVLVGPTIKIEPAIYDLLTQETIFDFIERRLASRRLNPTDSLASRIVGDRTGNTGRKKLGEESAELVSALAIGRKEDVVGEVADVLFAIQGNAVQAGVPWRRVIGEVIRRYQGALETNTVPIVSVARQEPVARKVVSYRELPLNYWTDVDEGSGGFAH